MRTGTLSSKTLSDGRFLRYTYDENKAITSITYSDDSIEIFERDTFQNVTRYVDRIGRVERMTYNEFGDMLTKEVGLLAGELHDASQDTQTDEYAIMSKTYYPAGHQNQHLLATEVDC